MERQILELFPVVRMPIVLGKNRETRMHSSRMRTTRLLTVSHSAGGVSAQGGVLPREGCLAVGMLLYTPASCRQNS